MRRMQVLARRPTRQMGWPSCWSSLDTPTTSSWRRS